jgi:hypothetical protein
VGRAQQAAEKLNAEITKSESALLRIREAAAKSGYSEEHLRRLAREAGLPVERNGGPRGPMRIRPADLPNKPRRWTREA